MYVSNKKEGASTQQTKDKDGLVYSTPLLIFLSIGGGLFIQKLYFFLGFFHTNTMYGPPNHQTRDKDGLVCIHVVFALRELHFYTL